MLDVSPFERGKEGLIRLGILQYSPSKTNPQCKGDNDRFSDQHLHWPGDGCFDLLRKSVAAEF